MAVFAGGRRVAVMADDAATTSKVETGRPERVVVELSGGEKLLLEQAAREYGFESPGELLRFVGVNVARGAPVRPTRGEPARYAPWLRPTLQWLLYGSAAFCVIAWLLIWRDTESVLVTGPVLLILGVLTMLAGAKVDGRAVGIGVAHCGICILFVTLVNVLAWSPGAAHVPFLLMGGVYIVAILPITAWVAQTIPPPSVPFGTCERCGYLLWGLDEPRCPECGTAFDAAMLPALKVTPPNP